MRSQSPPVLPLPPSKDVQEQLLAVFSALAQDVRRIADALNPPPADIVDSPHVANRLGCTTTWVADMVRRGVIPKNCLVPGTGKGKPWKFYRAHIDKWIESR